MLYKEEKVDWQPEASYRSVFCFNKSVVGLWVNYYLLTRLIETQPDDVMSLSINKIPID